MATLTFDTLKFVKKLTSTGMPEPQATAISDAIIETQQNIATSADIKGLKKELAFDIKRLACKIDSELKVLKWMTGFMLTGTASLILKSFFYLH